MATPGNDAAGKSTLGKVTLPAAVAVVGAGVGLLFTMKPKRLRSAMSKFPSGRDLIDDLKERVESVAGASAPETEKTGVDMEEFTARRRARTGRRERRRQRATT